MNHLIYPVPDPLMPFLGVHFTRMIDGTVEAGPNAVLAWRREGYRRSDISLPDLAEIFAFVGFWKLSARFWKTGIEEYRRSFSKKQFVKWSAGDWINLKNLILKQSLHEFPKER